VLRVARPGSGETGAALITAVRAGLDGSFVRCPEGDIEFVTTRVSSAAVVVALRLPVEVLLRKAHDLMVAPWGFEHDAHDAVTDDDIQKVTALGDLRVGVLDGDFATTVYVRLRCQNERMGISRVHSSSSGL